MAGGITVTRKVLMVAAYAVGGWLFAYVLMPGFWRAAYAACLALHRLMGGVM